MQFTRAACVLVAWTGAGVSGALGANVNDFINFSLPGPATTPLVPGRLYVPPEAASGPRPLILFLHGAGEAGTNNTLQINVNIDNLLAEAKRRGAYLYAPQAASSNNGWGVALTNERVMSMIDRALMEQNVDANRLYVTGLSMGGGGAWNFLNAYGDRFAAGVPICGVLPATGFLPANLLDESIWAFHARNDQTVSVANTRSRYNSILAANGESAPVYPGLNVLMDFQFNSASLDLHYTEYYTGGHGIWPRVYNGVSNAAMYDWLFSKTSAVPEPASLIMAALFATASWARRRRFVA